MYVSKQGFTPQNNEIGCETSQRHRHTRSRQLTTRLGTFTHLWSYRLFGKTKAGGWGGGANVHLQKQCLNYQCWPSKILHLRPLRETSNYFSCFFFFSLRLKLSRAGREKRESESNTKGDTKGDTFWHGCFLEALHRQTGVGPAVGLCRWRDEARTIVSETRYDQPSCNIIFFLNNTPWVSVISSLKSVGWMAMESWAAIWLCVIVLVWGCTCVQALAQMHAHGGQGLMLVLF